MPKDTTPNAEQQLSWYHCGRCGSLFQSALNLGKSRRCNECGFSPNPPVTDNNSQTVSFSKKVETVEQRSHGQIRKTLTRKKSNPFIMKLILIWVLVSGLIVLAAKTFWHAETEQEPVSKKNDATDVLDENENFYLLNKSMGQCIQTMQAFLQSGPPEQRSQYVMQPIKAVARMSRHQEIENISDVSPPLLDISLWDIVSLGEEKAIEAIWVNPDGRRYDAIFRKDRNEWLIDWEHFVRYSDMPLPVFLSGDGDAEGEFRLLARERLAEERKNLPTLSIVFYAPVFGRPEVTVAPTPEFLVERKSPEGILFETAFSALKNKKRPFDAKLTNWDPDGMIRVRVKIRRSGEQESRKFEIAEVKACHWYSNDLSGFDPTGEENGKKSGPMQ